MKHVAHPIAVCALLSMLCTPLAAVEMVEPAAAPSEDSSQNTRVLRGALVSLNDQRELVSDVGTFQLPASAEIIDRREADSATARVEITRRHDQIIQVILY